MREQALVEIDFAAHQPASIARRIVLSELSGSGLAVGPSFEPRYRGSDIAELREVRGGDSCVAEK